MSDPPSVMGWHRISTTLRIEIPSQVAYVLAKAQDETSALRREIDHLQGHGTPSVAWVAVPTLSFLGKDNDDSRSPSHTRLSPLTQSLSLGNDADDFESLSRAGMAGDMPEYLDSNLASPELADPEEWEFCQLTSSGILYANSALRSHFEGSNAYMHLVGLLTTKSLVQKRNFIKDVIRTYSSTQSSQTKPYSPTPPIVHSPDALAHLSKLQNFCKDSTAELDEAIRSIFRWYCDLALMIVNLSDVVGFVHQDLVKSKWFKRRWTLQELLAPRVVRFYDKTWTPCVRGPQHIISSSRSGWIYWRRRKASLSWRYKSSHRARKTHEKGYAGYRLGRP
ncbi:hypothetical protein SCLCIDRAFT_22282 [Scleroderma citrinum Foug A]|uniref:Uncharacterized protein n=1 Tax=Scleroderma citrinum Foug A TaxID=1036808 RepID=A0A0C3ECK3_9AGAM|nr:hypothetical protein SCLCIDRAFT_22282 [Scleroderma citrinum Foug A]